MDDVLKDLFFDVAVKIAISEVITALPFLGWPIIGPIFGILVNWIAGKIFTQLKTVVDFTIIDLKTDSQKSQYNEAVTNLQTALNPPSGEQNTDDVEKAKEAFKAKLQNLVSFGVTPSS